MVVAVVIGLIAIPGPAHAAGPAADISIHSVRLTDRLVLRIDATYVCPPGFVVDLSRRLQAFAGQNTESPFRFVLATDAQSSIV